MKTCPCCAEEIQDAAVVCKHCHRDLPKPSSPPPEVSPTAPTKNTKVQTLLLMVGGVLFLLLVICVAFVAAIGSTKSSAWKIDPVTKQRYLAMPQYNVSDSTNIQPSISIQSFVYVTKDTIETDLKRQLGQDAKVTSEVMKWEGYQAIAILYTAKPPKPYKGIREVWIELFHGEVICVTAFFEPCARDWSAALAMVGLEPRNTAPTVDAIGAARWHSAFQHIDEVEAVRKVEATANPTKSPEVVSLTIEPNKRLPCNKKT